MRRAAAVGDLVYAFLLGVFVVVGFALAGEQLVQATGADSATWRWEPIVFGLAVVAGGFAMRAVRRRQARP
jgi:MYXO-CTERM domain-containing protein